MVKPERTLHWEWQPDGTVLFRQHGRAPTYRLTEPQFTRLQEAGSREANFALISILGGLVLGGVLFYLYQTKLVFLPVIALLALINEPARRKSQADVRAVLEKAEIADVELDMRISTAVAINFQRYPHALLVALFLGTSFFLVGEALLVAAFLAIPKFRAVSDLHLPSHLIVLSVCAGFVVLLRGELRRRKSSIPKA